MSDYISRADAIEAVKHRLYETAMNNMEYGDVYVDIAENRIGTWLSELPSADAVEVVICKDCKHWHSNTEFCSIWSFQNIAQRTFSDDYCSRAERKEP